MTKSRIVHVRNIPLGGDSPVFIQSMTNTDTEDVVATLEQCQQLIEAGCEIIRISFPTEKSIDFIAEYKAKFDTPLVADIHFDYKLAIKCIEAGVDKIRINPGNIGSDENVKAVISAAKEYKVPIRIGVNGGSLPKNYEPKGDYLPIVSVALDYISFFENEGFRDIVVSVKTSDVPSTIRAYKQLSANCDYPLHVGVTEAGTVFSGTIKSAVGIGAILAAGIGNTIRVSLTGDPVKEVAVAKEILQSLGLRKFSPQVISCPTCGRTKIDLEKIANQVEQRVKQLDGYVTVAVMGCAVNGPGEAKHADVGVACGIHEGLLFKKGEIVKKVPEDRIVDELIDLARSVI